MGLSGLLSAYFSFGIIYKICLNFATCLPVRLSVYSSACPTHLQGDPHTLDEEQHGNPYRELCLLSGHRAPVQRVEALSCSRQGQEGGEERGGRGGGRREEASHRWQSSFNRWKCHISQSTGF